MTATRKAAAGRATTLRRTIGALLLVATLCAIGTASAAKAPVGNAVLVVRVTGLSGSNSGERADVGVRGPSGLRVISHAQTLRHLLPGRYTVTPRSFSVTGGMEYGVCAEHVTLVAKRAEAVSVHYLFVPTGAGPPTTTTSPADGTSSHVVLC